ncbi:uncharacterized protein FA14DRAFT_33942 [Meira miltonrushii]|uniref:KN homeodomain domain-containing protein n=1 Tax=Meira miltonrushii TaxID=1280837 RepID=A0A316VEQ2_9BASI|nr:uncharacterized protein FA14DRAFT_33942 [Meira miltonrushii]PWN34783.1 hypothetical protein FA14DRAFT_33942 [Meira miltonrushii]
MLSIKKNDLQAFFENAEMEFLIALQENSMQSFHAKFHASCSCLTDASLTAGISQKDATRFSAIATRIRDMTKSLIVLVKEGDMIAKEAVEKTKAILSGRLRKEQCSPTNQDSLNSQFLRRWFLEHIDHPFPSTVVKEELAELTNAKLKDLESRDELPKFGPQSAVKPISKNQCQLWFINTRRRSTWTEFYREYAFSEKSTMTKLVSTLKGESESANGTSKSLARILTCGEDGRTREWFGESLKKRVAMCQDHWVKIMEWLEQRPHEQQSDWLSQAIEEATSEYNQTRKSKRDQHRTENGSHAHQSDDEDYSDQLQSKKRVKKRRTSDGHARPIRGSRRSRDSARKNVRRPSTMISSIDQYRDVSGSSTSTLDTSCSSISTSSYATASSPLASYGKAQETLEQKKADDLEGLYHEPKTSFINPKPVFSPIPASPLQYGDDEMGDDDGEFELDDFEEAKQGDSPWN